MTELNLRFEVLEGRAERYSAEPSITFRLRVTEDTGVPVHSLMLRTQVRIEPQLRTYTPEQKELLFGVFSDPSRWADTLKPFLWAHVSTAVRGFEGSTEFEMTVPCSYDMEVASGAYFHAMRDANVPLIFLFNGQVFLQGPSGVMVQPVPWDCEANYTLPGGLWQQVMDYHYPNAGWLRAGRDTLDALARYKASHACATWDDALTSLLEAAATKEVRV